jgi:DNA-binding NarL/FixJ family response regulator
MMHSKLKVLIVEDSTLILERMNSLLSEMECISEILRSENGIHALSLVEESRPDIILLDINPPGKSGISILKEIKSKMDTKVIMLTNYSDKYYRKLCFDMGADHFLDKSTEFDRIPDLIHEIYLSAS